RPARAPASAIAWSTSPASAGASPRRTASASASTPAMPSPPATRSTGPPATRTSSPKSKGCSACRPWVPSTSTTPCGPSPPGATATPTSAKARSASAPSPACSTIRGSTTCRWSSRPRPATAWRATGGISTRCAAWRSRGGAHTGTPLLDPDRFDVDELADADHRELAAVAGALDAAKGQARIGLDDAVDEDVAGLDLGGQPLAADGIAGPHAGAEAERGAVRQLDGVRGVARPYDRGHRSEGLLVEGGHAGLDAGEHRRRVEPAPPRQPPAAGAELGAGLDGPPHLVVQGVEQVLARQGAHLAAAVHGVADLQPLHGAHELLLEAAGDLLFHAEALGGDAALAG